MITLNIFKLISLSTPIHRECKMLLMCMSSFILFILESGLLINGKQKSFISKDDAAHKRNFLFLHLSHNQKEGCLSYL